MSLTASRDARILALSPAQRMRFWDSVKQPENGCWPFCNGYRGGYGGVKIDKVVYRAHRVALLLSSAPYLGASFLALHKCNNPRCVNPSHLYWGTHLQNSADLSAVCDRTWLRGENKAGARLSDMQVTDIWQRYWHGGETARVLASEYNVSQNNIRHIVAGDTRKDVTAVLTRPAKRVAPSPAKHIGLPMRDRQTIAQLYDHGHRAQKLSSTFGVSLSVIRLIIKRHREGKPLITGLRVKAWG